MALKRAGGEAASARPPYSWLRYQTTRVTAPIPPSSTRPFPLIGTRSIKPANARIRRASFFLGDQEGHGAILLRAFGWAPANAALGSAADGYPRRAMADSGAATGGVSARLEDLRRIAALKDPILRNLLITQRYHDLSHGLATWL